jgi:hypothetical protein
MLIFNKTKTHHFNNKLRFPKLKISRKALKEWKVNKVLLIFNKLMVGLLLIVALLRDKISVKEIFILIRVLMGLLKIIWVKKLKQI